MPGERLIPTAGCWVRRRAEDRDLGRVLAHRKRGDFVELEVEWLGQRVRWEPLEVLRSGFQVKWTVQDVPVSATRKTLGIGTVVGLRNLAGREQVLVQWNDDGRSLWLPYENLRRVKDAEMRYRRAEAGTDDHAERFRLKFLAHALENWNQLTGSLDRLDVDPLPHQLHLVHRILSSGNNNWLIADDVGLGKTIEVGLLLAALSRRGQARRVLIVTPAGLTRQWQDELKYKFEQDYRIFGGDFDIPAAEHWRYYDRVIVSLDLAKRDERLALLRQAGGWDVVVFDEGHKLSRRGSARTERYRLAETLRPLADGFLVLSGTPHQGYADRFIFLLELVRPDLRERIRTLDLNPEVVGELILRNRKSSVTDAEGRFIFKGQQVHRVAIQPSPETRAFNRALREYLRRGYRAGEEGGQQRAIGFVMTVYRKLASSSIAAIDCALRRRLERLGHQEGAPPEGRVLDLASVDIEDLIEGGDDQDDLAEAGRVARAPEFFQFEGGIIADLLQLCAQIRPQDEKLRVFLEDVVAGIDDKEKLLVFTEYRMTQQYLREELEKRFPDAGDVLLIHGGMSLSEKLAAIGEFNEGAPRFLVSTEAGGEGLNLHRSCHIMVNYDLPWSPARLVQRIGRLYRYGQDRPVVVFNLHAKDSFDNALIDLMLSRVDTIVRDMMPVGEEFSERLHTEIVGEVLEQVDMASVLRSSTEFVVERSKEQVDDAVERARRARGLQDEILAFASSFDPEAFRGVVNLTMEHVRAFVDGMLPRLGVETRNLRHGGRVVELRLPEAFRGRFAEFGRRTVVDVTTDRRLAQRFQDDVLLDFGSEFFRYLIEEGKSLAFDGVYGSVSGCGAEGALAAIKVRWQNDQGAPVLDELLAAFVNGGSGDVEAGPAFVAKWLLGGGSVAPVPPGTVEGRREAIRRLKSAGELRLLNESTRFKHPNGLVLLAAGDFSRGDE
jgi:superfamily II DNA/RNA helicase